MAGQYEQGAAVGGGGCGVLDAAGPNRIADAGGAGTPTCGSVRALTGQAPYAVDAVPTVVNRPMSCPDVSLAPGRYTPADITKLNNILGGTSSCTVVFQPGVHYLDVFDPTRSGEARNVLAITNKNVKVIGGEPTGSPASASTFPGACRSSTGSAGVQLVLSARSAIRHTGGQVALCPQWQGSSPLPVLRQSASVESQPVFDGVVSSGFDNSANLAPGSTGWASTVMCANWFNWEGVLYTTCPAKSFATRWTSAGSGPLTSANVLLDAQHWPQLFAWLGYDDPGSHHTIDLKVRFAVSGTVNCITEAMPAGRSYGGTISYSLLNNAAGNTCRSVLTDQSQLNGATVTTTFLTAYNPPQGLKLDVRNMRLETNTYNVAAASAGTADAQWGATVPRARVADDSSAQATQNMAYQDATWLAGGGAWAPTARATRTFTLNGLTLPSGLNASDRINRLGVMLRGPSNEVSYLADPSDGGLTKVEILDTAGNPVCSTSEDQVTRAYGQSNQYLRYDLIGAGNCATALQTAGQLQGLGLRVSFRTGCSVLSLTNAPVIVGNDCAGVPIPKVDSVSLSVGTDSVSARPPYSSVSVDMADRTSFDAFGPVLLPKSDLDVRWVGAVSAGNSSRPLFNGPLQVHGLGIEQLGAQQGTVCCVVGRDAAVLVARVDGEVRAQAAVRVNPVVIGTPTTRRAVEVLSWKLCNRVGC